MSISKIDIDEVIYKLLQGLRQKGFSIGTDAYIKTTDLFHWFLKEKKGNSFADFAPYLAPLICKSDEEQTNFKLIFQELFTHEFTAFENSFFAERNKQEDIAKEKKTTLLRYAALALLFSAVLFGAYKVWQYMNLPIVPIYENLLTHPLYVNKNDTVSLTENAVFKNLKDSSKFKVEYNIRSGKEIRKGFSAKHYFQQYGKDTIRVNIKSIKPGIDTTIEFSEIFVGPEKPSITAEKQEIETGDENIFTANIDTAINSKFYWEIKKLSDDKDTIIPLYLNSNIINHSFKEEGEYLVSVKYDKLASTFPKDFPDEKLSASIYQKVKKPGLHLEASYTPPLQTTNTSVNKWWLMGLSLLSLIFFYITYKIFKENAKKSAEANNIDVDFFSGNKPPYDLKFLDRNKNISYTYDLLRLSNHLKKRIDSPDYYLDISKTIKQSIANRGFPTPGFSQKQQPRQCLFLIDQAYKNSQQIKLFSYLAMYLIQHQVKLDFYFYYQIPDKFYTDEDGPRTTLQTLKDRYYNCTLIFFTDGTNFPEYNAPVLKESITIGFAYWQHRLLVTPVNFNDWGRNEKMLSTFFNVLPADVVGLLELIRAMDADSSDATLLLGQLNTYQSKHVDFNSINGLKEYLNDEELFQWLCAIAIHPKIYWEVILEIGKAILDNPAKINYENLLKIARIQWVHEGNFPTSTRLELLKVLSSENEIKARDAFLKMLDEIHMSDDQFSYEEKQISGYANSFVLFATGIQKYTEDINIQEGEAKFISLYKKQNLSDNAFKIYIEKKETEKGNWNTPVNNENENIGIEKYIHNKETEQRNKIKHERLKRNKKLARYATCAMACLLFLGYLFYNKNVIAKSAINNYLKLADTSIQKINTTNITVNTRNCFNQLLSSSKDSIANLEILNETSVLLSKNIHANDSINVTSVLKNLIYDSTKNMLCKLSINGQIFSTNMPLAAGTHNLALVGCEPNQLNVLYNPAYNEDTTAVFKAFEGTGYSIKVNATSDYEKTKANMVIFDSAIERKTMFTYGENLIKAGFPLKNITIQSGENTRKDITITGEKELNVLPNITTKKLRALLLEDTITPVEKVNKLSVQFIYGERQSLSKIMQTKTCLNKTFNVTTTPRSYIRTLANEIKFYDDRFKDSLKTLLVCLKTYFPDKKFELVKSVPSKGNTDVAKIYLYDEAIHVQSVSISLSDEILIPQANRFKNDIIKAGYKSSALNADASIKSSVIEYHSTDHQYAANEIKKIYTNYFRTSPISLQYNPDPKNKSIDVRIKQLNEPTQEKFFLNNAKFPTRINIKNKFPITFSIGFQNLNNASSSINYAGKICLSEKGIKQNKALYICENFTFPRENRSTITKEIDATYNSTGNYSVRVIIEQLKIDTILGAVFIEENVLPETVRKCDTIFTYIGPGEDYVVFNGKTYEKGILAKKGIECSLVKKDAKSASINISAGKCPTLSFIFYAGETKTVTLCDDSKITLKYINSAKTSTNRQNNWALFDAVLCKPVPRNILKK